jgi:hypothetical protein
VVISQSKASQPKKAIPVDLSSVAFAPEQINDAVLNFDVWDELKRKHFSDLTVEQSNTLRAGIVGCLARLLNKRHEISTGVDMASHLRKSDNGERSHWEELATRLEQALKARQAIQPEPIPTVPSAFDGLENMVRAAKSELTKLGKLGPPERILSPWPEFVQSVYQCFSSVGLRPTRTGHVYDKTSSSIPSGFQAFMLDLNNALPEDILREPTSASDNAFYSGIAKALHGYK